MGKKKMHVPDGVYTMVEVFIPLVIIVWVLLTMQTQITNVKMFSILMTLGGLETYNDTVTGIFVIVLIGGIYFATRK